MLSLLLRPVFKSKSDLASNAYSRFLGGAFISLGFLLNIRVLGNLPERWGSLVNVLGGAVFPVGPVLVVLAGGELITGNMMSMSMALYAKKITFVSVLNNWI